MTATYCETVPVSDVATFEDFQGNRRWTQSVDADYHGGPSDPNGDEWVFSPGFLYPRFHAYISLNENGSWNAFEWGPDSLTDTDFVKVERQQYEWCIESGAIGI